MTSFSVLNRTSQLASIKEQQFDLIIIGGGITGAGIALDAASRGLKVCLFEKGDFASGTSSKSTKLIHGGLRYLKQFDIKLVRDTGTERAIVYHNAPHVVHPEKMLLPIIEGGSYGKFMTRIGLTVYDWLAKVKKEERRKMLSKEQVMQLEPQLKSEGLKGGGYYTEYRTDDARLTIEALKTAVKKGAFCFNYCEVKDFLYQEDKVAGVVAYDKVNQEEFKVQAKQIINAAGPWSDGLRKIDKSLTSKKLHLTKGVHIVVSNKDFKLQDTIYFDVPGGRMIFAIPRGKVTYIGTTDTNYKNNIDHPDITQKDVDYLLEAVNNMFPEVNLKQEHIVATWSGLRPLIHQEGKDPSEISRKDEVFESPTGLITITGGKLTGYRLMAKKVVDIVCKRLEVSQKCTTKNIKLSGGTIKPEDEKLFIDSLQTMIMPYLAGEERETILDDLFEHYGANITEIIDYANTYEKFDLLKAEVEYCIKNESVYTLLDYFIRRSSKMFFEPNKIDIELEKVADYFQQFFNWSLAYKTTQIEEVIAYKKEMLVFQ